MKIMYNGKMMPIATANDIKLILFDIGGVLIEYENVFTTATKDLHIEKEIINENFNKYDEQVTTGKITLQQLFANICEEYGLKQLENYDLMKSMVADYLVISSTQELLKDIYNSKKYKVGLLSNIYHDLTDRLISTSLIPNIKYDYKFISAEIGYQKPDIKIYEYVENQTGLNMHQIFFIDDKQINLDPAIKMGWQTFKFPRKQPESGTKQLKDLFKIN